MPRTTRYSIIESHSPWFPIFPISNIQPAKKTIAAMQEDISMPRVAVIPIKMPSQTKATTPARGIRYAHQT